MATKKSIKRAKKARPALKKAAAPAGMINTIIIATVIIAAATVIGIVASKMRGQALQKQNVISNVSPAVLTIRDNATGQEKQIPIHPASTGIAQTSTSAKTQAVQKATPRLAEHEKHAINAAARASAAAKTGDYSYLFQDVPAKEAIPHIDIAEAKYLFNSGKARFVDTRGQGEYDVNHIKGAVSVPVGATPEEVAKIKNKLKGKVLVTYCHGAGCHLADKTAYKLYDEGYRKILIFFGGWPKWTEHKYPIYEKPAQ